MYLLGLGFWFWTSLILGVLGMLLAFSAVFAQILLVARYGERIRQIIIHLPGYSPLWGGGLTNLTKPIKAWDVIGSVYYANQIQTAVFYRKPSLNMLRFRVALPKKIRNHVGYIKYAGLISLAMIFLAISISHVQQYGWSL